MRLLPFLRVSQLRHDTFILFTAQIFYKLSGIILLVVISRFLSVKDIGVYFFAISFAESFILLASFQLDPVQMRRVATDPLHASEHFSQHIGFRLFSSPIYLLCTTVAAIVLTGKTWWVIVIVAFFTLMENIYLSFGSFFIARGKVTYNVCIGVSVQLFFLVIFLIGMFWAPSIYVLLEANLLRSLLLLGTAVFVTHRWLCPLQVSWDNNFIKEGFPFILLALLSLLRGKVDTLLLGFLTDYEIVGHYQLALRIVFASFFVPTVIGLVLFPHLAAGGLSPENRRVLIRGVVFLVGLGLLCMAVVFLSATSLTTLLYGSTAASVAPVLRSLTFLFPLSFLNLFFSYILQALHQEVKGLKASAIGAVVSFIGNFAMIPLFGAHGAAYARVLSALVQLIILVWYLRLFFTQGEPLAVEQNESELIVLPVTSQE